METTSSSSDPGPYREGRSPEAPRPVLRSAGLTLLRLNPFRVLRLPTDVPSSQAVWKAEKVLARVRAGVDLPEPDLLGWLPAADELEIQQAAQKLEEPLRRLHDQLLWFDPADPHWPALETALATADPAGLAKYLAIDEATVAYQGEDVRTAHRVNQANLRLVLALSWLGGVGPELFAAAGDGAPVPRLELGSGMLEDPHHLLGKEGQTGRAAAWQPLLPQALSRWATLLAEPGFSIYVGTRITRLGDDLIGADDVEPVIASLRATLTDVIAAELKQRIVAGRLDGVAELAAVAANSGFDRSVWQTAFRPLRPLLAAELDELDALIDERRPANPEDIQQFLTRVDATARSWHSLDQAGLLGLSDVVDDAVQRAFLRLRVVENAGSKLPVLERVLVQAGDLARSASLRERLTAYRGRLKSYGEDLCHFCGTREAERKSCAALSGRVETGRTRGYNSTTIHYRVSSVPLPRCPRCAELHGFVRTMGTTGWWIATGIVFLAAVLFWSELFSKPSAGTVMILAVGGFLFWAIGAGIRHATAVGVVPKGEKSWNNYERSAAMDRLRSEGMGGIQYDWRPDAWLRISEQGHQPNTGDSGGMQALKTLGWILLVVLLLWARFSCFDRRH